MAEETLRQRLLPPAVDGQPIEAALHELQVHQIELEMQNEELRRLQVDLDASRARYFDLYDLAPVGYLTLNESGLVQRANLMGATLLGSTRAALRNQQFGRFLARADMDEFYLLRRRALAADQPESLELRMLRLDGAEFWAQLVIRTGLEDGARVDSVVLTDITDRKQAEETTAQLQAERGRAANHVARLNGLAQALGGAVDIRQVVAVINSTGREAAGARTARLGRLLDHGPQLEVPLADVVRTGLALWLRDPAEIADRSPALAAVLAVGGNRALACLPLISQGVTIEALHLSFGEQRTFDAEEQVFLASLAHQCALALSRAKLYEEAVEARDLSERAKLLRDEFLSIVAHDLGNPLNVVGLWAKVLLDAAPVGPEGEGVRRGTNRIKDGVTKMALLIDDLGDVSSIDSGHLGIRKQERDLGAMVTETIETLTPLCLGKELSLTGIAPSLRVSCDSDRIQQVLGNLVGNAIKFTPIGGAITIEVVPVPEGQEVRFSVSDTGPGIHQEARAHVFERYWRGQARDVSAGVGLGLFISHGIVEAHGGKIWVEAGASGGSRFCFTLPL